MRPPIPPLKCIALEDDEANTTDMQLQVCECFSISS
jgi:hypothetical protein